METGTRPPRLSSQTDLMERSKSTYGISKSPHILGLLVSCLVGDNRDPEILQCTSGGEHPAEGGPREQTRASGEYESPFEHQLLDIQDFTYSDDYFDKWVANPEGANGPALEHHKFAHLDMNLSPIMESGHFVLAKFLNEEKTTLAITGFKVSL